jgi:hypothetical protein
MGGISGIYRSLYVLSRVSIMLNMFDSSVASSRRFNRFQHNIVRDAVSRSLLLGDSRYVGFLCPIHAFSEVIS